MTASEHVLVSVRLQSVASIMRLLAFCLTGESSLGLSAPAYIQKVLNRASYEAPGATLARVVSETSVGDEKTDSAVSASSSSVSAATTAAASTALTSPSSKPSSASTTSAGKSGSSSARGGQNQPSAAVAAAVAAAQKPALSSEEAHCIQNWKQGLENEANLFLLSMFYFLFMS
jgi:cobalamin biosynthesis Mg chelatase CobN